MVLRHVTSSTTPSSPVSRRMKSPGWICLDASSWIPLKTFSSVGCSARPTARPPMPRAVRSGATEMPAVARIIRMPTTHTTPRARFTKMEPLGSGVLSRIAYARTIRPRMRAPKAVTTKMVRSLIPRMASASASPVMREAAMPMRAPRIRPSEVGSQWKSGSQLKQQRMLPVLAARSERAEDDLIDDQARRAAPQRPQQRLAPLHPQVVHGHTSSARILHQRQGA